VRTTKVYRRGGQVNAGRPWKVDVTGGSGQHAETETLSFITEEGAYEAVIQIRVDDLKEAGHDPYYCDLVSLPDDDMALCSCGVENACVECEESGADNNCIEDEEPEKIRYPLCSSCFALGLMTPERLGKFTGVLKNCVILASSPVDQ